jgi:hypothetical protein
MFMFDNHFVGRFCETPPLSRRNISGMVGVSPAGFGILPKRSFQGS